MVNVADIVNEVYSKLVEGVAQNLPENIFDALKLLKEDFIGYKNKLAFDCTLKQYISEKAFELTSDHVIGYKKIENLNLQQECITISLDNLGDELGEHSVESVNALSNNIGNHLQETPVFSYKGETFYFRKDEKKVGIIV